MGLYLCLFTNTTERHQVLPQIGCKPLDGIDQLENIFAQMLVASDTQILFICASAEPAVIKSSSLTLFLYTL